MSRRRPAKKIETAVEFVGRAVEDAIGHARPFVTDGMTVLEPDCGMGFLTLDLARLVGDQGKVVVVDIQPESARLLETAADSAI
ncbi:MAG: methyltransferase domain-containing protein [Gaiellaceae bacterium]